MEANELRIGNLVGRYNDPINLLFIDKEYLSIICSNDWYAKTLYPIPLTEKWLLKFGFTQHHGDYYNEIMMFKATKASRNEWIIAFYPKELGSASYPMAQRFCFVHQLQNLYHALTGKELTIEKT